MPEQNKIAAKDSILVEYSGGLDSTLATILIAKKFKRLLLVTYEVSWTVGTRNSKKNVDLIKNIYPECIIEHRIINASKTRNNIWEGLNGITNDYFKFCNNGPPGHICLGCKMAMLLDSIKICLEENIAFITNGLTGTQSDHPEHMPAIVNRFAGFMKEFGITYINDVYHFKSREAEIEVLQQHGINMGSKIGASSVTHQPRCLLGVYSTLWKASKPLVEKDMVTYFDAKKPLMRHLLSPYAHFSELLKENLQEDNITIIDESKEYKYTYEFSANVDKTLSLSLSPIWWMSKLFFLLRRNTDCCGNTVQKNTPFAKLLLLLYPALIIFSLIYPVIFIISSIIKPLKNIQKLIGVIYVNNIRDIINSRILPNLRCTISSKLFTISPFLSGLFYKLFNITIITFIWAIFLFSLYFIKLKFL